jgi:alpha-glucosidase
VSTKEDIRVKVAFGGGTLVQTRSNISTMLKSGVIFEIYPKSFFAGNGGRQGDLKGIIEKLDYLKWLGVQNLWLPPIYPSPMKDGGYDVTNYYGIHPDFGTLAEFDEVVAEADKRGIGIIMDLVVNHTSTEHEWFREALTRPRSPFRDRYIFRSGRADGTPPNNQISVFGGSVWEPVPGEPGTYYYHTFAKEQPDLNFYNPAVSAELGRIMRYWLDRGVKGIRVDAVHFVGKNPDLDEPVNLEWDGANDYSKLHHPHVQFQPKMYEFMNGLCGIAAEYGDRIVVFEATPLVGTDLGIYHRIYDALDRSVGAPFHFGLFFVDWSAESVKNHVESFLKGLARDAVPVWNVSNHDQPRVASRIGQGQSKIAMALMLTLPGIPTLYYGDEIGMENGWVDESAADDPRKNDFPRDIARTPMQWSSAKHAGFTSSDSSWIRPNDDFTSRNVEAQLQDPASMLNFTKQLIYLRKDNPVLELGRYYPLNSGSDGVYMFARHLEERWVTVILNFTNEPKTVRIPRRTPKLLFSQRKSIDQRSKGLVLRPNEVVLFTN